MADGSRLAIAILMLFGAMVAFFFAFHPHGVENVTDAPSALQWLMGEFDKTTSGSASATPVNPAPATGTTQAPGTSTAGGRG